MGGQNEENRHARHGAWNATCGLCHTGSDSKQHPTIAANGVLMIGAGFSAVATLVQWGLHATALLSPMMLSTSFGYSKPIDELTMIWNGSAS